MTNASPNSKSASTPKRSLSGIVAGLALSIAGSATASIINVTGDVIQVPAPSSVVPGDTQGPSILSFQEERNVVLPTAVIVDAAPGDRLDSDNPASLFTIPAGTCVQSHYVHFEAGPDPLSATGKVRFTRPILGVAVQEATLEASDFLGANNTVYPVPATDCTDPNHGCGFDFEHDAMRIGSQVVEMDLLSAFPGDRMRVITEGSCN